MPRVESIGNNQREAGRRRDRGHTWRRDLSSGSGFDKVDLQDFLCCGMWYTHKVVCRSGVEAERRWLGGGERRARRLCRSPGGDAVTVWDLLMKKAPREGRWMRGCAHLPLGHHSLCV